jgi:hypothetical protein
LDEEPVQIAEPVKTEQEPVTVKSEATSESTPATMMDEDEDEEEEEEPQNKIPSNVVQEYRTLVKNLSPDQPIFILPSMTEDNNSHLFDIVSLFPDLLLYTPPEPDSIGNDPYFDEAEYSRVCPFKLSTQRIVFKKPARTSRKRNNEGRIIEFIQEEQDDVGLLPRNERYDNTPQLSRKLIYLSLKRAHFFLTFL